MTDGQKTQKLSRHENILSRTRQAKSLMNVKIGVLVGRSLAVFH